MTNTRLAGSSSPSGRRTASASAAPLDPKSTAESFSYVAEPTLRFVVDLPRRPEDEDVDLAAGAVTSTSASNNAPVVVAPLASATSPAATGTSSSVAGSASEANGATQKRKRRMSLGAILHRKTPSHGETHSAPSVNASRIEDSSHSQSATFGAGSAMPQPSTAADDGATESAATLPNRSAAGFRPLPAASFPLQGSHTSSSASYQLDSPAQSGALVEDTLEPILHSVASLPPSFNETIRFDSRPSLADADNFSGSSQGSLLGGSAASVASTAPTSPGTVSHDIRSSGAVEASADSTHVAFGKAQDGTRGSALSSAGLARVSESPVLAAPISLDPAQTRLGPVRATSSSSDAVPAALPQSALSQSRQSYSRGITRNIESLSLSDLPNRNAPPGQFSRPTSRGSSGPPPSSSTSRSAAPSLRGMPRLLSTSGVPMASRPVEEEDQERSPDESETDTDADDQSDDEGDTYATGDEGPVTSRSPATTPGLVPPQPLATPRPSGLLGGASSPGLRAARLPSFARFGEAAAGPSSWVAFSGATPTPGPMRTTKRGGAGAGVTSYFDMPRAPTSAASAAPTTPLVPMSASEIARGKRPEVGDAPFESSVPARTPGPARTAIPTVPEAAESPMPAAPDSAARAGLYRLRSHSVVALASPSMVDEDDQPVGTAAMTGLDPVWQTGAPAKQRTPAPSFLSFSLDQPQAGSPTRSSVAATPLRTPVPLDTSLKGPLPATPATPESPSRSRAQGQGGYRLQRTRSMYELRVPPPAYENAYNRPGQPAQIVHPREEEGREGLPDYTCAIHIEGYMPRKMEFTAPGVQARDRTWRRQYFVLHGTSIKIFKYNLRTHPIPGEEDWSSIPVGIAGHDGPPPLHFHEGEYGVVRDAPNGQHRFPMSIDEVKAKAKERIVQSATSSAQNALVRHYSLQNAESGLAADYIKRKHVVRVRAEGEQFLLQAKDDRGVIDLIEALQAGTNVALDLDARPLPKFITLPRRRRRRRRPAEGEAAAGGATTAGGTAMGTATPPNGAGGAGTDSPTSASGAGDRMTDMLAEEQNAYAQRSSGTVM